jgi:hypothetical protein
MRCNSHEGGQEAKGGRVVAPDTLAYVENNCRSAFSACLPSCSCCVEGEDRSTYKHA